jgi:calcineurin-like phosphoesterase family protein
MTTFFTSDTHFGHSKVIEYCNRPWVDRFEMDAALIELWNATVRSKDEIWHLGDFAFFSNRREVSEILGVLNGRKYLVAGNHDHSSVRKASGWEAVFPMREEVYSHTVAGVELVLRHVPLQNAPVSGIHLHGHKHGGKGLDNYHSASCLPNCVDVGVDVDEWGYRPVTLTQILRYLEGK